MCLVSRPRTSSDYSGQVGALTGIVLRRLDLLPSSTPQNAPKNRTVLDCQEVLATISASVAPMRLDLLALIMPAVGDRDSSRQDGCLSRREVDCCYRVWSVNPHLAVEEDLAVGEHEKR